jgi:hypothetical protein
MRGTRPGKHPVDGEVSPALPRPSFPPLACINTLGEAAATNPHHQQRSGAARVAESSANPLPTCTPTVGSTAQSNNTGTTIVPRERGQSALSSSRQTSRSADIDHRFPPTPPKPVLNAQRPHPDNLTAYIERLVAQAPPLTDSQRAALQAILTTHKRSRTP